MKKKLPNIKSKKKYALGGPEDPNKLDYTGMGIGFINSNYKDNPRYQPKGKVNWINNTSKSGRMVNAPYVFKMDNQLNKPSIPTGLTVRDEYKDTTGDKIHNTIADIATGVATFGTGFRKPTKQEYEAGRLGGPDRRKMLINATTQGLANELIGAGLGKLAKNIFPSTTFNSSFTPTKRTTPITRFEKNLDDLEYAKSYFNEFGYDIPKNLKTIARSNKKTDITIKGLVDQHNTFVRGVSTNWKVIEKSHPEILKHLEDKGIDYINNPKAAAEYMGTHIPINTGYGRAGINSDLFTRGKDALYTSNSIKTAEGYTYGDGYIIKAKKPTNFSSNKRSDWITKNELKYNDQWASGDDLDKIPLLKQEHSYNIPSNKFGNKYSTWGYTAEDVINKQDLPSEKILNHRNNLVGITKKVGNKYNKKIEEYNNIISKSKDVEQSKAYIERDNLIKKSREDVSLLQRKYLDKNIKGWDQQYDKYAHYIHTGTPGTKILEPVESIRITPEIYNNNSRAHFGAYSKGLTAGSIVPPLLMNTKENKALGGKLNNKEMKNKIKLPQVKSKPKYTIELDEEQMYSLGGWLKENAGGLAKTVGGVGLTAAGIIGTPFTGGASASLIGAGVGIAAGGIGELAANAGGEPETIDYSNELRMPRTVGKENMTPNVMHFKKGGKIEKVMGEFKRGTLHSGSKKGPKVKSRKQAIAIALSEAREAGEYAYGGDTQQMLNGSDNLMEMEGPSHEEGGIQFTPDAEVQGGETINNEVVNSDDIIITKEIATQYGLPKKAIGKTPAQYSKEIEKRYEGREVDPFAENTRKREQQNISKMSAELGEILNKDKSKFHEGGGIKHSHDSRGFMLDENGKLVKDEFGYGIGYYGNKKMLPGQVEERIGGNGNYTNPNNQLLNVVKPTRNLRYDNNDPTGGMYTEGLGIIPRIVRGNKIPQVNYVEKPITGPEDPNNKLWGEFTSVPEANNKVNKPVINNGDIGFAEGQLLNIKDAQKINKTGNPWNAFENKANVLPNIDLTPNTLQKRPASMGSPKLQSLGEVPTDWGSIGETVLGAAPAAISAFMAARTAHEGYDKVKLPRVHANEMNPALLDPTYQMQQASDTFNTGNEQMSQISKKDYLRRRIQSATEETKAKSGILGQVQNANTMLLNQAKESNQRNKMWADSTNLNSAVQEEQINAGNKGAWQTARDYQLSNLGTMAGEIGRDIRLTKANKEYNDRMFEVLPSLFPGQTITQDNLAWRNTDTLAIPESPYITDSNPIRPWNAGYLNDYENSQIGQGLDTTYSGINRSLNNNYGNRLNPIRPILFDRQTGHYK